MSVNPTQQELLSAILSMDVYNRGNGGLKLTGTSIGNLDIDGNSDTKGLSILSFFAQSYKDNKGTSTTSDDETIISFRGTDSPWDIVTGWLQGVGGWASPQTLLALAYYAKEVGEFNDLVPSEYLNILQGFTDIFATDSDVENLEAHFAELFPNLENGQSSTARFNANVSFTGHSLGGGLAGFLAEVYGKEATVFNSMPFDLAAQRMQGSASKALPLTTIDIASKYVAQKLFYASDEAVAVNSNQIRAFHTGGEILLAGRNIEDQRIDELIILGESLTVQPTNRSVLDNPLEIGPLANAVDFINGTSLHSQALLVTLMFSETPDESLNVLDTNWRSLENTFIDLLYNDEIAVASGSTNSADMLTKIAYSAINEGTRIFGDTAVSSLFNDANELGKAVEVTATSETFQNNTESIAKIFVQYASHLADNEILKSVSPNVLAGVLDLSADHETLTISFNESIWAEAGKTDFLNIIGRDEILTQLNYNLLSATSLGSLSNDVIENIIFTVKNAGSPTATIIAPTEKVNLILGSVVAESITGSSGDDILIGNGSGDTLIGGGGNDVLTDRITSQTNLFPKTFDGGAGVDLVDFSYIDTTLNINLANNSATVLAPGSGSDANYVINNIENVLGGKNGDIILGNSSKNLFNGGDGFDTLKGESGNDTLNGGGDKDTLIGGTGDDILDGGSGADTYIFDLADNEDTIMSSELADKVEVVLGGVNTVLQGEAILSAQQNWTYEFNYGASNMTSYFNWTGDIDTAGSTGTLTVDFDATLYYDLVIENFQNGDFGIDLGGTSGDGDRGGNGGNFVFTSPSYGDGSYWGAVDVRPFDFGDVTSSGYDGDPYVYETSTGYGLYNSGGNGMIINGAGNAGGGTSYDFTYANTEIGDPNGLINDNKAITAGDPHILTYDGLFYDFQDSGEFTLVQSTDSNAPLGGDFVIQVRQEKWTLGTSNDMFSVNTAVATQLGTTKVGLYINGSLPYDNTLNGLNDSPFTSEIPALYVGDEAFLLPSGGIMFVEDGLIYRSGDSYTVINNFGDGFIANVGDTHINLSSFLSPNRTAGTVEGLVGNGDGDTTNDFALDDGTVLGASISENTLYDVFGEDWRITQSESLFLYGTGENTSSFDNPTGTNNYVTLADLDPVAVAAAQATAVAKGFDATSDIFDAIVMDIIVLGEANVDYTIFWQELEDKTNILDAVVDNTIDDIIQGTSGSEIIYGTALEDIIVALAGNDTVYARAGNDTIYGSTGDDVLVGEGGFDTFTHNLGDGNDTLHGFTINHNYSNALSVVFMNGVAASDLYLNVSAGDLIVTDITNSETLTLKNQFIYTNYGYEFASVNGIDVTNGFTVKGTSATLGETLSGGDGADIVLAQAGNDTAYGGAGNDTITGGTGDDVLVGDTGFDTFIHNRGDGNDTLHGYIINHTYNNALSVIEMNDATGVAISANDIIFTVSSADLILTDITNGETLTLKGQYASTTYGYEFDNVNGIDIKAGLTLKGTAAAETINSSLHGDTIIGGMGDDTLVGNAGTDTFTHELGDGNDILHGYVINNTYNNALSVVLMNGVAVNDLFFNVSAGNLIVTDIASSEFLTLKGQFLSTSYGYEFASVNGINVAGGLTIKGTSATLGETLSGGDGADIVLAQAGNDTAYGGAGNDTITGGTGDDVLIGDAGLDTFIHNRGDGNDTLHGYLINNTYNNDLSVIEMNDATGVAISANDIIFTVSSADLILTDITNGETLTLKGQYASTTYGYEFDNVNGIDIKAGLTLIGTAAAETINSSLHDDTIIGGLGDDTLVGNAGTDTFTHELGDGNDILHGSTINNTYNNALSVVLMNGVAVNDLFFNVSGADLIVTDIASSEFLTLKGQLASISYGYEFDSVNGIDVTGGLTIKGTSATAGEYLYGTSGSDTIIGGAGADTLAGNAGADIFKFESLTDSTDTSQDLITDFVIASDIINFSSIATIDDITDVTISSAAGFTYVDDNLSDFSIKLTGTLALSATDFAFI